MQPETDVQESTLTDRLNYLFLNLVGQLVSVRTVDGAITEGLFIGADEESMNILLSKTRYKSSLLHTPDDVAGVQDKLVIPGNVIVQVDAIDVKFSCEHPVRGITGHRSGPQSMKRWSEFGCDDDEGEELEDDPRETWDQFEENRKRFNVKSTYKEEIYTTALNRKEFTKEQILEAERKAAEIERSQTRGIAHRSERDDALEVDDAELYSNVQRTGGKTATQPTAIIPAGPDRAPTGSKTNIYRPPGWKESTAADETTAANAPPQAVGDSPSMEERARHMATQHPQQRVMQPTEVKVSGAPAPLGQQPQPSRPGLNVTAREFKPQGHTQPPVVPTAPAAAPSPSSPQPTRLIDNMLETLIRAIESTGKDKMKNCTPDWPGDDMYYDEEQTANFRNYPNTFYQMPVAPSYHQTFHQMPPMPGQVPMHHGSAQGPFGNPAFSQQQHPVPHAQHHPHIGPPQQQFPQQWAPNPGAGGYIPRGQGDRPEFREREWHSRDYREQRQQHYDPSGMGPRSRTDPVGPQSNAPIGFQQNPQHSLPMRGGMSKTSQVQPQQPLTPQTPGGHTQPPMSVDQSFAATGASGAPVPQRQLRGRGGQSVQQRSEEPTRTGPPGSAVETGKRKK